MDLKNAKCLGEVLVRVIHDHSDQPALWVKNKTYTYAQLGEAAVRIARSLTADLAPDGGRACVSVPVGIWCDRNETAYFGILAAVLAGRAYVPLNPRFPVSRNLEMLRQSGAADVICDERGAQKLREHFASFPDDEAAFKILIPDVNLESEKVSGLELEFSEVCSVETAYIIFTSGTTGVPKAVPVTQANLLNYLQNISDLFQIQSSDRLTQSTDFTFDYSVHEIFSAWTVGASIYSIPEGMAAMVERFIRSYDLTVSSVVPSSAAMMLSSGRLKPDSLPSLRLSFFGGEALATSVASAWKAAATRSRVFNLYGPTETTIAVTYFEWKKDYENQTGGIVPLGKPFSGQSLTMMPITASENESSIAEAGELVVSGSQVTPGYLNNASAKAEKFIELSSDQNSHLGKSYRTGDQVTFDAQFGFQYRGRIDRQMKVRGFRVEATEIESSLRQASGCDWVAVVGLLPDAHGIVMGLVGFVVLPLGTKVFSEESVIRECKNLLPDYMVPSRVIVLQELPLTANGKVDYASLSRALSGSDRAKSPN